MTSFSCLFAEEEEEGGRNESGARGQKKLKKEGKSYFCTVFSKRVL